MLRTTTGSALVLLACLSVSAEAREVYFRTPSGNIYCGYTEYDDIPTFRCDISELTPSFEKPADCGLDYGSAFQLTPVSKRGEVLCAGDTIMTPDAEGIGYGRQVLEGGMTCKIEKTGVTCTNRKGHGFFISKAKQKVF